MSVVIPSSLQTVHATVTSTVLHDPTVATPAAPLIHQTKPLDLHAPVTPTKVRTPVPEVTVAAFELYTPSVDVPVSILAETAPTKSKSGPTPGSSSTKISTTEPVENGDSVPHIVAGLLSGSAVLMFIFGWALLAWLARRRRRGEDRKANESAPVDMEAVLEFKRQRAHDLGMKRWSRRNTRASMERFKELQANAAAKNAAKKADAIVEKVEGKVLVTGEEIQEPQVQYDRARRPSGLAMHPPTPVTAEFKDGRGKDVGRAI